MAPITPQVSPNPAPIETRATQLPKPTDASSSSSATAPSRTFAETMRAAAAPPTQGPPPVAPTTPANEGGVVRNVLQNVAAGHREMDRIIQMAQSGRSFSSAQLIGLQARVFRISTEIDLASKLLEKVTSGVKQTMSTQV